MFDSFPSDSGLPLWPDGGEANNNFIYYLAGGFGLIYLMCLALSRANSRSKSCIIAVPPNEDVEDEKSLHKYLLVLSTSLIPGSSCPCHAKVFVQIMGQKVVSKFYNIKVFSNNRFLLQRGNTDILLIRTKDYLGPIQEVKIVVSGVSTVKWRPSAVSVTCLMTRENYTVDCRLIHADNPTANGEDGHLFSQNKQRWSVHAILRRIGTFHPWLSPFNVPLRFGAYTTVVSTVLFFLGLTLLMTLTMMAYIMTTQKVKVSFSMPTEYVVVSVVVAVIASITMYVLNIFFRNVKSGQQETIDKYFTRSDICVEGQMHRRNSSTTNIKGQTSGTILKNCIELDHVQTNRSSVEFFGLDQRQWTIGKELPTDIPQCSLAEKRDIFKSCIEFTGSLPGQSDRDKSRWAEDVENEGKDSNNSAGDDQKKSKQPDTDNDQKLSEKDGKKSDVNGKQQNMDGKSVGVDAGLNTGQRLSDEARSTAQECVAGEDDVACKLSPVSTNVCSQNEEVRCGRGQYTTVTDDTIPSTSGYHGNQIHSVGQLETEQHTNDTVLSNENEQEIISLPPQESLSDNPSEYVLASDQLSVHLCTSDTEESPQEEPEKVLDITLPNTRQTRYRAWSLFFRDRSRYSLREMELSFRNIEVAYPGMIEPQAINWEAIPEKDRQCLVQKEIDLRQRELTDIARRTVIKILITGMNTRHLIEENKSDKDIQEQANIQAREWMSIIGNELYQDFRSKNRILKVEKDSSAIQEDWCAVSDRITAWPRNDALAVQCVEKCIHLVCETTFSLDLFGVIRGVLVQYLDQFSQEFLFFVKHGAERSKDPCASVSTEEAISSGACNIAVPSPSSPSVLVHQEPKQPALPIPSIRVQEEPKLQTPSIPSVKLKQHGLNTPNQQSVDTANQQSVDTANQQSVDTANQQSVDTANQQRMNVRYGGCCVHEKRVPVTEDEEYLASVFIDCMRKRIAKDKAIKESKAKDLEREKSKAGDDSCTSPLPSTDKASMTEEVQHSASFLETSAVDQLSTMAVEDAKKELWTEYQDPIYVYCHFLLQGIALNRLPQVLAGRSRPSVSVDKVGKDRESSRHVSEIQENSHSNQISRSDSEHFLDANHISKPDSQHSLDIRLYSHIPDSEIHTVETSHNPLALTRRLSERFSLMKESMIALVPLLLKKSNEEETSADHSLMEPHEVIGCLDKKWHCMGFHRSLRVDKHLAQALMVKLVKEMKDGSEKSVSTKMLILENPSCLGRIEKELCDMLPEHAAAILECWCPLIQSVVVESGPDVGRMTDQVCVLVDVASQELIASLHNLVQDILDVETVKATVFNMVQHASSNLQTEQALESVHKHGTMTSYEADVTSLLKDIRPLKWYLTRAIQYENIRTKERMEYIYLERYQQKHNNFAVINFQHVLDSYYDKDPEMIDTSLTDNLLLQLEWQVMRENTKIIPTTAGKFVTFLLFCLTMFGIVYTTMTGASLDVTRIQEWMACFCMSVALNAFVLEPCVDLVGYLGH